MKTINSCAVHCVSIAVICAFAPLARSTDYYVSPSGNDGSSGSATAPWKSINKVNGVTFSPGDRILFQGGSTFAGRIYFGPGKGGTATNPITVTSYGTGKAIIDAGTGAGGFFAWQTAGIDLINLIFKGSSAGANLVNSAGILFYNDMSGNVILPRIHMNGVEVYGFGAVNSGGTDPAGYPNRKGGEGINIGGNNGSSGYSDIQITNSLIHDNEGTGLIIWGPEIAVNHSLYIGNIEVYRNTGRTTSPSNTQYSGAGAVIYDVSQGTIEHSSFHDNGASGNGTAGLMIMESDHITAQYNQSYHNRTGGNADGDGFDLDGGTTDCLMQYNFSYGNDGAGYLLAQPPGIWASARDVVRYNITENDGGKYQYGSFHFWNGGPGIDSIVFYNNTVYSSPLQGGTPYLINFTGSPATNLQFRNNIFITTSTGNIMTAPAGSPGSTFQYNDYWTGGGSLNIGWAGVNYASVSAWSAATGQESSKPLSADPKLASPGGGVNGYKLLAGSPMIDAGTTVTLPSGFAYGPPTQDYYGDAVPSGPFDIGADEAVGVSGSSLPTISSFTASPSSVTAGISSTLSWNVSNATSVVISGGVGTVNATGSVAVAPTSTTTYTLTASNSAGTSTANVTVTVTQPVLPVISSFAASPASITGGTSSTLSWNVTNATSVTISGGVGTVSAAGSVKIVPTMTTTYTLTAGNAAGTSTASVTVTVTQPQLPNVSAQDLPVIISFTATQPSVASTGAVGLSWNTSNATTVSISPNVGVVAASGSVTVTPSSTTTYVLTASNGGGSITQNLTITVTSPPDTVSPVVSITSPAANGPPISGVVTLSAKATDNVGVVGVQFQINGVNFGPELTGGVYSMPWDTASIGKGNCIISAIARDAAGNRAMATIKVNVHDKN